MEFEDHQEIDVCDDSMNNEYPEQIEEGKNDDQDISANRESIYLSASELFLLRRDIYKNKSKDENIDANKGPKLYDPSDPSQDKETMENLLQNHKKSLKLPRGAKIRDCVKGEWNEELKIAIVPHLKGKSTQHMGYNFKGKIALSPEETLFLLEKNCIEVSRNNMPMSIEEAFTVMLKENLGLEKYQVYSHLSQQGFIVVKHQARIGPRYEEIMNLSRQKQRKRKATNLNTDEPGEKRLTFTGVLASNAESNVTVNVESNVMVNVESNVAVNAEESILSSDCEVLNSSDSLNKTDTVPADCDINKTADNANTNEVLVSVSSQHDAVLPDSTNQIEPMDLNANNSLKHPPGTIYNENNSLKCPTGLIYNENDPLKSPSGLIYNKNDLLKSSPGVIDNENDLLKSSSGVIDKENDALKNLCSVIDNQNDELKSPSGAIERTNEYKTVSDEHVSSLDCQISNVPDASDTAVKALENVDVLEVDDNKQKDNSSIEMCKVATEANEKEQTDSSIKICENVSVQDTIQEINGKDANEISNKSSDDKNEIEVDNMNDTNEINNKASDDKNEIEVKNTNDTNEINNKSSDDKNEIQVENTNDLNEIIIDSNHGFDKSENINIDESLSGDYDHEYSSDESLSLVCEDRSGDESVDVLSCSSDNQESTFDGINSESSDIYSHKDHDDEITLIEVRKKENMPLAVIDLLSDDELEGEKNAEETFEDSDDEIQVVKVCPVAKSNVQSRSRNLSSVKSECKNENIPISSSADIKSSFRLQMKFPEMFRKDVLCLPRPPANLLPNHVRPAKEAYVINRNKSAQPNKGRLWNSFRDMQEYQRERRRDRQSNNSRPFNSLRDFRFQNDSLHNNRMSPFNRQENSQDMGFDRSNQNYGFQQTVSSFNPPMPMAQLRGPSLLPSPDVFTTPNRLPFMNIPSLHNLSSTNPVAFVNEIQKTVYSVASSMLSSMLGQHLNPMSPAARSSPTFSEPPPSSFMGHNSHNQYNNFAPPSPMVQDHMAFNANSVSDFNPVRFPPESTFSSEMFPPYSLNRGPMFGNNWRPNNFRPRNFERKGPLFPCPYREVGRKRCWGDVKAAVEGSNPNGSDSGSDIEEVPINLNQFLWSTEIQPLVKPGSKLPVSEVLQKLRITQLANLLDKKRSVEKYMAQVSALDVSFDVYLPGSKYKKTAPGVPKHRIIVLRAADPIPKLSELVFLQRKWNDNSVLQMAVVDHGDISFYSFNNVDLNGLVPHEEE